MGLQNFRHPAIGPFVGLLASDSTIRDGTSEDEKKPNPFDSDTVFFTSWDVKTHPENCMWRNGRDSNPRPPA